jgi:tRNA threonylcarbamoyladenosine biosynthesis protein TsaE
MTVLDDKLTRRWTTETPDQTAALATAFASYLQPGDTGLFHGPIGAGKSHFIRTVILAALERPEPVPSPSYTLVQTYEAAVATIWHADLYRLSSVDEVQELGLDAAFAADICLIEWPDRLGTLKPKRRLDITLSHGAGDEQRNIEITAEGTDWDWLQNLDPVL